MAGGPGFRLFGIPIRVELFFFATVAFLGWSSNRPLLSLAIWVVIAFVSVLWHELGHAFAFKAFGHPSQIVLYGMGGGTSPIVPQRISPGKDIVISLAGPLAGFAFGGLVLALSRSLSPAQVFDLMPSPRAYALTQIAISDLLFVNFGWGILNLVPMLPLDGGRVMASLMDLGTKGKGQVPALVVSLAVGAAAGVYALLTRNYWIGLLALMFTATNYSSLRQAREAHRERNGRQLLTDGYLALDQRDGAKAASLAEQALADPESKQIETSAATLLMSARLQEGSFEQAALAGERLFKDRPGPNAAYHIARAWARAGRPHLALEWVKRAVELGYKSFEELEAESDLDSIRSSIEFDQIRRRLRAEAAGTAESIEPAQPGAPAEAAEQPSKQATKANPASPGLLVKVILAINLVVFLAQQSVPQLTARFAASPARIAGGEWYRLLTPMLLHADFIHIGFNSYALWIYGPNVEESLGKIRFLALYVVSGFIGGVASYTLGNCSSLGVGASGAIFGIVGALAVLLYRRRKVSPASLAGLRGVLMIIGINLLIGFAIPRIDNFAHMGGLVAGGLLGAVFDFFKSKTSIPVMAQAAGALAVVAAGVAVAMWRTSTFTCPGIG